MGTTQLGVTGVKGEQTFANVAPAVFEFAR